MVFLADFLCYTLNENGWDLYFKGDDFLNNYQKIWKGYYQFKSLAYVVRAGFGYTGIYPIYPNDLKPDKNRKPLPESDLEHVAGMIKLVRLISWYFPEIIPKEQLDDFLFGAELHEMGELLTGDIIDDGVRNENDKDFLEAIEIREYLRNYAPEEEYSRGIKIFKEMQEKKTVFGQTLYFIDKLEANLQAVYYESLGHPGRLSYKEKHYGPLSNRDKRQRNFTGSDKIVDNWTYGFVEKMEKLHFKFAKEFYEIMSAAVQEVRKKPFSWID